MTSRVCEAGGWGAGVHNVCGRSFLHAQRLLSESSSDLHGAGPCAALRCQLPFGNVNHATVKIKLLGYLRGCKAYAPGTDKAFSGQSTENRSNLLTNR
jgi:hypothetical protein